MLTAVTTFGCVALGHADCATLSGQAADLGSPRTTAGQRTEGAFVAPVVDERHGLVYGVAGNEIVKLDERTGRRVVVASMPRNHSLGFLAVDPAVEMLVVEDAVTLPDRVVEFGTDLVSATTGAVRHRVRTSRVHVGVEGADPFDGTVAVDPKLHHAFVTDATGAGVALDLESARELGTFSAGPAWRIGPLANRAVEDIRAHRLFIGLAGLRVQYSVGKALPPSLVIVNTATGKVVARERGGQVPAPVTALLLDAPASRLFLVGISTVEFLNTRTGRVVRTATFGNDTRATAWDPHTGDLFVLTGPTESSYPAAPLLRLDGGSGRVVGHSPFFGGRRASLVNGLSVGPFSYAALDARSQTLVIDGGVDGTIEVIDARTGRVLRRASSGQDDQGIAVDEQRHRAYVGGTASVYELSTAA
jgi:DNA-binding beta-propeller fold protein YncE